MGYVDYRNDLLDPDFNVNRILDRYFHSGQSAVFIGADPRVEPQFKNELSRYLFDGIGVHLHPLQLVICGSAHLGFSPVPFKLGKPFDPNTSDIDVSVVSGDLFDRWWAELQAASIPPPHLKTIAEELYWGFINPMNARSYSSLGQQWWEVFRSMATDRAQAVRGRLYRNFWSMENYHRHTVESGRHHLQRRTT